MSPATPSVNPYRYADMTWPQVAEASAAAKVAIIPLGACEQHGHGLALRTDTTRAEVCADMICAELGGAALVTPALPVGVSEHHMGFPGTLTLSPDTLCHVLYDVVDSLRRHGVRRIFVLTGHGGNIATIDVALARLATSHPDVLLAFSGMTSVVSDLANDLSASEIHGHSSEIETSQAWFADPTLVRPDDLVCGSATYADLDPAGRLSRTSPGIRFPRRFDELSQTGALGDPTRSTPEMGEQLMRAITARISQFLRQFNEIEPPS